MKKKYSAPKVVDLPKEIHANALYAAAIFLARAIAKSMKGHIDLFAGADSPRTLQAVS